MILWKIRQKQKARGYISEEKTEKKSKQSYHNDTSEVEIRRGIELFK